MAQLEHRGEAETESRAAPRTWVIGKLVFRAKSFPTRSVQELYMQGLPGILLRVGLVLEHADIADESDTIPAIEKLRV